MKLRINSKSKKRIRRTLISTRAQRLVLRFDDRVVEFWLDGNTDELKHREIMKETGDSG